MITIVVVVTILLALLAEGAIRFRQHLKYGQSNPSVTTLYKTDQATGLRLLVAGAKQGDLIINKQGFRGPAIPLSKPEKTIRIAFIGASTTFSAEVRKIEDTWPHLVTQTLKARFKNRNFDYINAGVPGFTVQESLKNLKYRVGKFNPDIIFIYYATNDFSSDVRDLAGRKGNKVEKPQEDSWLTRNSVLWFLLKKQIVVWHRQRSAAKPSAKKFTFDAKELSKLFEKRLGNLTQESKRTAKLVVLATFSPRLRQSLSPEERIKAAITAAYYMPHISITNMIKGYEQYNTVIRKVARKNKVVLVDVADKIPPDGTHYNDSVHFREAGSREMAKYVISKILDPVGKLVTAQK